MSSTVRDVLNRALRVLGEPAIASSVSTITEDYHKLLLGFLNEIKEEVESAHTWRAQRQTVSVTIDAGTSSKTITEANERSRLVLFRDQWSGRETPLCFDVTDASNPIPLYEMPIAQLLYERTMDTNSANIEPVYFALDNQPGDVLKLQVYPTPVGARTIQLTLTIPQGRYADSDMDTVVQIPTAPLYAGLMWYATLERGEELGAGGTFTEERFRVALDDAIGRDMGEQGGLTLVVV